MPDSFTPSDRSRVKRMHERAAYDRESLHAVIDAGIMCNVGYVIDGQPYVTPTFHWREGERLYWHGSSASRMVRATKEGIPVCVTVSHLDGLVMARSGMHHSANYRAAMMFGTAHAVTDADEKMASLKAFVDRLTPGRWDEVRPPNPQEFKATTVLAMTIEEASVKVRTGGPVDDDEDYALDCWAGVVPVNTTLDTPEPDTLLREGIAAPDYLKTIRVT